MEHESISKSKGLQIGSPPHIVTHSENSEPSNPRPYLILDVREPHQFASCHLLHAHNYPFTMMRRDLTLPELTAFKNKENMLIIIYCDDERISRDAAKLHVDRGIDNIFLLSGGMMEFAEDYPEYAEGYVSKNPTAARVARNIPERPSESLRCLLSYILHAAKNVVAFSFLHFL